MLSIIQKLKYTVRTVFGDSESSFGGEELRELEALMGVGQVNRSGPTILTVIRSVFFDVLKRIDLVQS